MHCEGYAKRASQPDAPALAALTTTEVDDFALALATLTTLDSPLDGLLGYSSRCPTQARLANVGVALLVRSFCDQFEFSVSIFERVLPQLSHALPSVNAAAAALGAIYEVQMLESTNCDVEDATAAKQYDLAIRSMQHDIRQQPFGRVPLMMICILLACSELLLRRRSYALMHAEAAFNLLNAQRSLSDAGIDTISELMPFNLDNDSTSRAVLDEAEMFMLFRAFDVQVSFYADRRTPRMPSQIQTSTSAVVLHPISTRDFEYHIISVVHDCLYFTSSVGHLKYVSADTLQSDAREKQARHVASLTVWLQKLDQYLAPGLEVDTRREELQTESRSQLLTLRNLCLSMTVIASTILTPYETAFDAYSWHFQQIVLAAEEILEERDSYQPTTTMDCDEFLQNEKGANQPYLTFTPLPGLLQPLFLTALKYRHPKWRRRAINLMRRAGVEGPWIGKLIAVVAERLAEVEEVSSGFATFLLTRREADPIGDDHGTAVGPSSIPEAARISGVGMDVDMEKLSATVPNEYQSANWTAKSSGRTCVRFMRCKGVETMLEITRSAASSPLSDESNSPRRTEFGTIPKAKLPFASNGGGALGGGPKVVETDDSSNNAVPTWNDKQFWDAWEEVLEFGRERRESA